MTSSITAWYQSSYLRRVACSLRDRGIVKTLRLVKEERWLERCYGIRISGIMNLDQLSIRGSNASHGYRYEAVNYSAFRLALGFLNEPLADYVFIDLGSGKGFALILASQYGFKKLIGVEFSPVLSGLCRQNLSRYYQSRRLDHRPPFEVLDLDVTEFVPPPGNNVFFLCNPFDEAVVRATFRNVRACTSGTDRTTYVVYVNAVHMQTLLDLGFTLLHFSPTDPLRVYHHGIAVFRA